MNRSNIALTILSAVLLVTACSDEKKAVPAPPAAKKEGSFPPRTAVVTAPTQPYREMSVALPARIMGTVDFDGVFPADSLIQLTADQMGCGHSVVDNRIERTGTRVSGVAVWLTDIRQGRPLGVDRRFELMNEGCVLSPRVQTVMTGGTLNVISADVAMHRDRIIDVATGEVQAIAPFNDKGQVIPFDRLLTKTAELEVICELHPWSKAYLLVFDHPYHAVTGKSGDFSIEGIPAGTYHLRAWHPVLGLVDQTLTVGAGAAATVALKLPGESAPLPAAIPAPSSPAKPTQAAPVPASR